MFIEKEISFSISCPISQRRCFDLTYDSTEISGVFLS